MFSRRATETRAFREIVRISDCQSASVNTSVTSRKGHATESTSWASIIARGRGRLLCISDGVGQCATHLFHNIPGDVLRQHVRGETICR